MPPLAVLDIDGTLADSNYQHTIAWYRALRQQGLTYPLWQIHRRMGMGGEKLVADLAGDDAEREHGEAVPSAAEKPLYLELIHEVAAVPGARALVEELKDRGHEVLLASWGKQNEVDHYLDLIGLREIVDGSTTGGDVEETKPAPAWSKPPWPRRATRPGRCSSATRCGTALRRRAPGSRASAF